MTNSYRFHCTYRDRNGAIQTTRTTVTRNPLKTTAWHRQHAMKNVAFWAMVPMANVMSAVNCDVSHYGGAR